MLFDADSAAAGQCRNHVFGLQAFVTLHHGELDALTFYQDAVTFTANGAEVHENIVARIAGDKAEAFRGVEPLNRASFAVAQVLRLGGAVAAAITVRTQVEPQVHGYGGSDGQQAEQGRWLAANERQWGQQDQGLQGGGKDQ